MTGSSGLRGSLAAAAARADARRERVALGLEELELWLLDLMRVGIADLERTGYAVFDQVGARMVDAQAPGVAGLLRSLPAELGRDGWPGTVLERLGALYLLTQAHRRLDELPDEVAATVRQRIGYPISRASVLARPGVTDHWFVAGIADTVEFRLESRRAWLYGAASGRWALLLSFAPPGGPLDDAVRPGEWLHATLHPYAGSGQFRAVLGSRWDDHLPRSAPPAERWDAVLDRFAELLALDPWATRLPVALRGAVIGPTSPDPTPRDATWRFRSEDGRCVELVELGGEPWPLFAHSLGDPITLFGEWSVAGLRPLAVLPDEAGAHYTSALVSAA